MPTGKKETNVNFVRSNLSVMWSMWWKKVSCRTLLYQILDNRFAHKNCYCVLLVFNSSGYFPCRYFCSFGILLFWYYPLFKKDLYSSQHPRFNIRLFYNHLMRFWIKIKLHRSTADFIKHWTQYNNIVVPPVRFRGHRK